ncbi:MAG: DNA translocase FtsK 4TM domain-containing protein [Clostridia bacterium]|nr:DNA translocase FtsK 4TM domain-containing protein [Clostridia bacterium]
MAESKTKKKSGSTNTSTKKKPTGTGSKKRTNSSAAASKKSTGSAKKTAGPSEGMILTGILLLTIGGIFLLTCILFPDATGSVGSFLHDAVFGLFGRASYFLPVLLFIGAYFFKKDVEYHAVSYKFLFAVLLISFIGVLFHVSVREDPVFQADSAWGVLCAFYDGGTQAIGGGVFGGLLTKLLGYLGLAGTWIVAVPAVFLLALFYVGMTPKSLWITVLYHIYKFREKQQEYREAAAPEKEARQAQLKERQQELARMRQVQIERQRMEQELRAQEKAAAAVTRRRGVIDENIYADPTPVQDTDRTASPTLNEVQTAACAQKEPQMSALSASANTGESAKTRKPRRSGTPVPEEVYDRHMTADINTAASNSDAASVSAETGSSAAMENDTVIDNRILTNDAKANTDAVPLSPIITVNTETGEVFDTALPQEQHDPLSADSLVPPDPSAYASAAQDVSDAIARGVPYEEDTASQKEIVLQNENLPASAETARVVSARAGTAHENDAWDIFSLFDAPNDNAQIEKYGPAAEDADQNDFTPDALTVTKTTPDGCIASEDTPPWEDTSASDTSASDTSTPDISADTSTQDIRLSYPAAMQAHAGATPNGMTEIPDVVSKEQIEEAIRASKGDILLSHKNVGDYPGRGDEPDPADDPAALLASLNAAYTRGTSPNGPYAAPSPAEPPAPVYVYPPVTLLKKDTSQKSEDVTEELETNAKKLTEILASFHVKTKLLHISRGPTITRYELQPEAGTRVRSIANLVDDIALGLAADGIRIEAPIPGKSAIGIEVPNQTVSTVYIRDLIESDAFKNAKGKLTTALGMDVAGAPVFLDAAKMPHLLICGATGMGKSVCINALIVSMLYKSAPNEVKLILIDPKKVELNIYSGIPHLLVPVVSDPKKAAGALHWAVTEMERRFELIEDVGMRDIKGYNDVTKNDPDREYLPQIVIIIDELADLMMTAPDEVEESICRLAQKARAAGMYLIIGTQRPSVDVITGLIKANIPSRIAFRVSSQMDSRVILDEIGAEKLIGRGDMLYKPVGAPKPKRVQGSFVSEEEIDQIINFLKKTAGHAEYSDDVMESIEKEAAMCGQKKGARTIDSDDDDGDGAPEDPMLKKAIELAVESGKISTSLIQRRLSLGYARAAKLIDRMESLGYVSPPEGSKPRQILITKEQYMELVLKQEDIL